MFDDEGDVTPSAMMCRVIPIRAKLVCGHWGQVMMSRREYNEWVECGMPLYVNTGEPQPCDRCKGLDSPEPLRHIEADGSQHTPS